MVTCDLQEKVAIVLLRFFLQNKIYFEGMLNLTIYEWVGVNSYSMSWPAGTGPGLYKQIVMTL